MPVYSILCEQLKNQNPSRGGEAKGAKRPWTSSQAKHEQPLLRGDALRWETHHINPKCLGGNDDESNLVLVTRSQHSILHLIRFFSYNFKGFDLLASACLLFEHPKFSGNKATRTDSYLTLQENLFFCLKLLYNKNCFENIQNQPLIRNIVDSIQKKDILYLTPKIYATLSPEVKNNDKIQCFMLLILLMQVIFHLDAEGINAYDIIVEHQQSTSSLNPKNQLECHKILLNLDQRSIYVTRELNFILHYIFFLQSKKLEYLFSAAYLLFPDN